MSFRENNVSQKLQEGRDRLWKGRVVMDREGSQVY